MSAMKYVCWLLVVATLTVTGIGCGREEVSVPAPSATDQQKMDEYYQKLQEAEAKGIDPATIPAP